jgi:hypothetical protein
MGCLAKGLNKDGLEELIKAGWSKVRLSRHLGISRTWLIELMKGKRELKHKGLTASLNTEIKNLLRGR